MAKAGFKPGSSDLSAFILLGRDFPHFTQKKTEAPRSQLTGKRRWSKDENSELWPHSFQALCSLPDLLQWQVSLTPGGTEYIPQLSLSPRGLGLPSSCSLHLLPHLLIASQGIPGSPFGEGRHLAHSWPRYGSCKSVAENVGFVCVYFSLLCRQ